MRLFQQVTFLSRASSKPRLEEHAVTRRLPTTGDHHSLRNLMSDLSKTSVMEGEASWQRRRSRWSRELTQCLSTMRGSSERSYRAALTTTKSVRTKLHITQVQTCNSNRSAASHQLPLYSQYWMITSSISNHRPLRSPIPPNKPSL